MTTGLKRIKKELGPDALILSTRTVRNGKLGLLGKPMLEITAAIDSDLPHESQQKDPSKKAFSTSQPTRNFHTVVDDTTDNLDANFARNELSQEMAGRSNSDVRKPESDLQGEVNELKNLVRDLAGQIEKVAQRDLNPPHQPRLTVKNADFSEKFANSTIHGDHLLSCLIDRGINVESARTIAGFLRETMTDHELSKEENVFHAMGSTIQDLIQVAPPELSRQESQQRIALVGPTGVGKTTTLAKLAASHLSKYSPSIALITIDTYRIAAVEQLKVYGEIMRLPVEVVINPQQLQHAIAKHSDKDLILIDTAGRSPRDSFCIDELASFLVPELNINNCLVMSAATRERELIETIERFHKLGIHSTIFTKIDECASLGVILNVQIQNPSPLAWVTNGQRVPEDLLEITPARIAELILSNDEGPVNDEP